MITLTRNQIGLGWELKCEVCKGAIVSGDRFYAVDVKEGHALTTKLYHFYCVQRGQAISPEAKDRQEKLASVIAQREATEEQLEEAEQSLTGLMNEESQLRRKLGEVYK